MYQSRRLQTKRDERRDESLAALLVGLDWLNGRPSKGRTRIANLIQLLKTADSLSRSLRERNASLPATTHEEKQLLFTLDKADEILSLYRGTRVLWVADGYGIEEIFGLNLKRLEKDDAYYSETRVMNYALELLRRGSIQRLRTCRECKKWYYAVTDHQTHCSPKCRQRFASHNPQFQQRRRKYMRTYRLGEKNRNKRAQSIARRVK